MIEKIESPNTIMWSVPEFDPNIRQEGYWWVSHPDYGWRVWKWQKGEFSNSPWEWSCGLLGCPHSIITAAGWIVSHPADIDGTSNFW
jgi:hypothetical protein